MQTYIFNDATELDTIDLDPVKSCMCILQYKVNSFTRSMRAGFIHAEFVLIEYYYPQDSCKRLLHIRFVRTQNKPIMYHGCM